MKEVLLHAGALDAGALALFVAAMYLMGLKPRRPARLRVVRGVRCWCKAFNRQCVDCYCVRFAAPETNSNESGRDKDC